MTFPLDTDMARLARSYLRVAAAKPESTYALCHPVSHDDRMAYEFLLDHEMVKEHGNNEDHILYQVTSKGVTADQQMEPSK